MSCCIAGCPNEGATASKDTTYHLFPHPVKDRSRFGEWVNACINPRVKECEEEVIHKRFRICRRHFDTDCFNGGCRRLLNTAVPTLFLNESSQKKPSNANINLKLINSPSITAPVDEITYVSVKDTKLSDEEGGDYDEHFKLVVSKKNTVVPAPIILNTSKSPQKRKAEDEPNGKELRSQPPNKYAYLNEIHSNHRNKVQKTTDRPNPLDNRIKKVETKAKESPKMDTDIVYELLDVEDEKYFRVPLTDDTLKKWRADFYKCEKNVLAQNVCSRVDPFEVCLSRKVLENTQHVFTYKVESEGKPLTNQKNSGRCWIFAALNTIRIPFMKQYNLDEFEFSQTYLFYWDKIERCHYFLNNIIETAAKGEEVTGRLVSFLLNDPTCDGGQWDMIANLINKHGLVPKKCFPETYCSEASIRMNAILKSKLREYTKVLRDLVTGGASDDDVKAKLNEQMAEIYRVVGICLGIPDEKFKWEYYDKSKAYQCIGPIRPIDFYEKYVRPCYNVDDKVCIVTDPRTSNVYGQAYTVEYLGNVVGGRPVLYNNQPVELLMELVTNSLKNSEAVWFGCEVSKRFAAKQGIEDLTIHDFKLVFGVDIQISLSKGDRMDYGESAMTHAMVFTAVSCDDNGTATKFRVENSWGEDRGEKGYLIMSADWFKEFVFEIVVDKSIVPKEVLDVFEQTPIVLPAWDPMGTLAKN